MWPVVSGEAQGWAIPAAAQAQACTHPDTHQRATFPPREVTQVGPAALRCNPSWCQPLQNPSPWLQTPLGGSSLPAVQPNCPRSPSVCIWDQGSGFQRDCRSLPLPSLKAFSALHLASANMRPASVGCFRAKKSAGCVQRDPLLGWQR